MEKTFEAIMQAVRDGNDVRFRPARPFSSTIIILVENSRNSRVATKEFTSELIYQTNPIIRDHALSGIINKLNNMVLK